MDTLATKKRPVHLRMPADLFSIIDKEAKTTGKTFTQVIVGGLNRGFKGNK